MLLVDDDLRTTRRMADMLREDGFEVEIARDGAAAVARLNRFPVPDALVTELTTAHADGAAISRFARSQRPGLPVFVVTGYPNLFEPGAFGSPPALLFTKPVDYSKLQEALRQTLSTSRPPSPNSSAEIGAAGLSAALELNTGDVRRNAISGTPAVRAIRRP